MAIHQDTTTLNNNNVTQPKATETSIQNNTILQRLLQNLSFMSSDLDGDEFYVVWSDRAQTQEEEEAKAENEDVASRTEEDGEEKRQDNVTREIVLTSSKPKPGGSPRLVVRRTPSPHFLNRKKATTEAKEGGGKRLSASRHVRFHTPSNIVVLVPNRHEFDASIQRALWTNAQELQDQVYRNKMEYLAEGLDWQKVLENDDFYTDVFTGELVHPYWVEQATHAGDVTPVAVDDY